MPTAHSLTPIILTAALGLTPVVTLRAESVATVAPTPLVAAVESAYGRLPMSFEVNQGQADSRVQFLARGRGHQLFLTPGEAVLGLKTGDTSTAGIRMKFDGADPTAEVAGLEKLPGIVNYLIGPDPSKWHTEIPTYQKVQYRHVYPGIDLVYYGDEGQLEYDFVVAPGADPKRIALRFDGAEQITVDENGDLVVTPLRSSTVATSVAVPPLRLHKPVVYQMLDNGERQPVDGAFVVLKSAAPYAQTPSVAFEVAAYDTTKPLVIDPVLSWATYLGGNENGDYAYSIAADAAGNTYITGSTQDGDVADFPTTAGAFQTSVPSQSPVGRTNAFVSKLNASGSALIYSTYLGGGDDGDVGMGIAIDSSGNAYVTGSTTSADFPTTPGAFLTAKPAAFSSFVSKLNPSGSALIYSTFWFDGVAGIAVDSARNVYVAGMAGLGASAGLPTTPGAFQTINNGWDAFVSKLNATGTALVYSTYLGGTGQDEAKAIAVDASGNAYVAGYTPSGDFPVTPGAFNESGNGFITKLNAAGSALVYSARLKGYQVCNAIAIDASGNAHVTGRTQGSVFVTTPGAFQPSCSNCSNDAFVTKLNPTGSALVYSTYLSGSSGATANSIAVDAAGNVAVTGDTSSADFPVTPGAFQTHLRNSRSSDAFVSQLNPTGSALVYSTFLGGSDIDSGRGIALDPAGNIYVAGYSFSANFPTTPGTLKTQTIVGGVEGFVAKVNTAAVPFARFLPTAKIDLQTVPGKDWFEMRGTLRLGDGSNGIDPLNEAMTIQIGTFSKTIPAGSFKQDSEGFYFSGRFDGVRVYVALWLVKGKNYGFFASANCTTLTGTRNPVRVALAVGDDAGSANITAEFGPKPK